MPEVLKNVRVAIFDLDGTLFDSTHVWEDIDDKFLSKRGYAPTPEYHKGIAALGNREVAEFTIEYYGLSDTTEELMREWFDMAIDAYTNTVELIAGAGEYVRDVAARGIRIYAVTSLSRELAEPCLKRHGLTELLEELIASDDCGLSKSSPDIFTYAARRAGVAPRECVVFDDVAAALRSAKAAGMITVAVRGDKCYIHGGDDIDAVADHTVTDYAQAPILNRN